MINTFDKQSQQNVRTLENYVDSMLCHAYWNVVENVFMWVVVILVVVVADISFCIVTISSLFPLL